MLLLPVLFCVINKKSFIAKPKVLNIFPYVFS